MKKKIPLIIIILLIVIVSIVLSISYFSKSHETNQIKSSLKKQQFNFDNVSISKFDIHYYDKKDKWLFDMYINNQNDTEINLNQYDIILLNEDNEVVTRINYLENIIDPKEELVVQVEVLKDISTVTKVDIQKQDVLVDSEDI